MLIVGAAKHYALRMTRHNKVCHRLVALARKKGWLAHAEKVFRYDGKVCRPDIVVCKGKKALVIDVTVRYEVDKSTLRKANNEKVNKYTKITNVIKAEMGVSSVEVFGFPLGARGMWYPLNSNLQREGERERRGCPQTRVYRGVPPLPLA